MTSPRIPASPPSLPHETTSAPAADKAEEAGPSAKRSRSMSPSPAKAPSTGQPSKKKQKMEIAVRNSLTAAEKFAALPDLHPTLHDNLEPKEYARFLNEAHRARAIRNINAHSEPPASSQRKDILRNAFRYTVIDAVLSTYRRHGQTMLKDPDLLRRLGQELQRSEVSLDDQFKLLMRLPNSHVRTSVIENIETACRQELVAGSMGRSRFEKDTGTIAALIESWPDTVGVAGSEEASRLIRLTQRYQKKLDQWPEGSEKPELSILINAWANAFQAGTFDAGDDWRPVARILGADPAALASAPPARRNQFVHGISHWQRQGLRRLAPSGNTHAASQSTRQAQVFLHTLAHQTNLSRRERIDFLNTITDTLMLTHERAGVEISPHRPLYRTTWAMASHMGLNPNQVNALAAIIRQPRPTQANIPGWIQSLHFLQQDMEVVPCRTRANVLESLTSLVIVTPAPFAMVAPFINALRPHVGTMPPASLGMAMLQLSVGLERGRGTFAELQPILTALKDKINVMPAEHLGIAMESLAGALGGGRATFAQLRPIFTALIGKTDVMPANRLGGTMAKLSSAFSEGRVAFGELEPVIFALKNKIDLMPIQNLGEALGNLSSALGQGRATFADLEPIFTELTRKSAVLPPQDLGETMENLSSALYQGRATFIELEPIFMALKDKFDVMPPDHLGQAMAGLSLALYQGRATITELQPILMALKDKINIMPSDSLDIVMEFQSRACDKGYATFTQLQPIFMAMLDKMDAMPPYRLGYTVESLSSALTQGHAAFAELAPIFRTLTGKIGALPLEHLGITMKNLSFSLEQGRASFAELKPMFMALMDRIDVMPRDYLGDTMWDLSSALAQGRATFTKLQPIFMALMNKIDVMSFDELESAMTNLSDARANGRASAGELDPIILRLENRMNAMPLESPDPAMENPPED